MDYAILNNTLHCTVIRAVMLASVIHSALSHVRALKFRSILREMLIIYSTRYKISGFSVNRALASAVMDINFTNIYQ